MTSTLRLPAPRVGVLAGVTRGLAALARVAATSAVVASLSFTNLSAQSPASTAKLTVTVVDTSGVVPGATVSVRMAASEAITRLVTDADGRAEFPALAAGTYDVRAEFPGFADTGRRGVALAAGAEQALELKMTLVQFSSEVTVTTASRREQLLLDVADATVLIDRGQIADTGARTAKDLLIEQSGAGIQVQAGGGQGHVSINGIPNSGVLVLIDGRRYLGRDANGNLNLEDLTLSGVDRVEVVKGASSALYGSDALGGVINFITRRSTVPGVYATSTLSGGSYGDFRGTGALGWRGTRGGIGGSGGYRQYDGFDLSESNPQTIGQPESTWWNADVNADVKLGERIVARVFADQSNRDIENYFFSGATQLPATVYDSQRTLIRQSVMPQFDVQVSPSTFLTASYTYGKYARDETRVFSVGGRVVPQAPWREWNQELKVSGRHDWSAFGRQHPLQVGVERRDEKLRRGTLSVTDPERDINVLWFQQEVAVTPRLRLAAGVRYDDYSDFGSEWSPKVNAVFAIADQHRLRGSYGHGFRPPYFNELYLYTPPSFVGNPNLTPESSDTINLGYAYSSSRVQVSLDLYQAAIHDGITFDLSTLPFTYVNLREYHSRGANVTASMSLPGGFTPSVSYSYNRREDDQGNEIGGFENHSAVLKLLWTSSKLGLRANVRGQVLGDVPPATDGTYRPGYSVFYAQVAKQFKTRQGHAFNLYAQVDNLFDTSDIFLRRADGSPVPGEFQIWLAPRTFQVGITMDLDWMR